MDRKLKEAVAQVANESIKGFMGDPPNVFTGQQLTRIERAVGHEPLTSDEMTEALKSFKAEIDGSQP